MLTKTLTFRLGDWLVRVDATQQTKGNRVRSEVSNVWNAVHSVAGYTDHDIRGRSKEQPLCDWRMVLMHLLIKEAHCTLTEAARLTNRSRDQIRYAQRKCRLGDRLISDKIAQVMDLLKDNGCNGGTSAR